MISRWLAAWCVLAIVGCGAVDEETVEVEQALASDLVITPGAADFGSVVTGTTSAAVTFTVTNTGAVRSGPLTRVLAGPDAAAFTLTAGCGNRLQPGASCTFGVRFRPTAVGVATASVTISGNPGGAVTASLTGTGVAPAALAIAPASYDFGATLVGGTSAPASFTVTNVGGSASGVPTVTVPGAFTVIGTTCVAALAPGATCVVTAAFSPGSAGNKSGNLKVKATPGGTVTSALSGTGLAPGALAITPSIFDFGVAVVGTASATGTFTVSNTGGGTTGVPTIVIDGANASAFSIVANTCTAPLAAGASCTVGVRFAPVIGGSQIATLAVSAAGGGNVVASLAGTGVAPASLVLTPTAADFGSVLVGNLSSSMVFTVANTGGAASGIPAVFISGSSAASFMVVANTCVAPLAAAATCTFAVRFAPFAAGAATASLNVAASPGGTVTAALAGTGVAPGQLAISPASQDFGAVVVGDNSAPATFTVSNIGGAATGPLSTALTGTDAAAFSLLSTCTVVLAPGASCTVSVRFSPVSAGVKSANLLVSASPGGSVTAALAGTGLAPASLAITPTFRDFGSVLVGDASALATFTVTNTGGQVSGVPDVQMSGADAAAFSILANSCGVLLAPGASCTFLTRFAPVTAGAHSATVTVSATPGGTVAASLVGTGVEPGQLVISPSVVSFGNVVIGQSSTTFAFVVQNVGGSTTGPLDVTLTGADTSSFTYVTNCTVQLAPGASCTITAQFVPASAGAKTASLSASATPGGTATAALTGTGIAPAALAIAPASADFGTVVVGETSTTFAFTVVNIGGIASGVPSTSLGGGDPASFSIVANACTSALAPGASCTVFARFTPSTSGAKTATLQISASPGGTVAAALTGTAVVPSSLAITPAAFDFGSVVLGSTSSTAAFTVTNSGGVTSGVASVALTGSGASAFSLVANTCAGVVLAPGASCVVTARFSPVAGGIVSASLTVSATPGGTVSAALTGTGIPAAQLAITPSIASFGSVAAGTTSPVFTFVVTNNGGTTSGIVATSLGGADPSQFEMLANSCAGVVLAPFASCTVSVRFAPVSTGNFAAALDASATPGGTASAALTGNGS